LAGPHPRGKGIPEVRVIIPNAFFSGFYEKFPRFFCKRDTFFQSDFRNIFSTPVKISASFFNFAVGECPESF